MSYGVPCHSKTDCIHNTQLACQIWQPGDGSPCHSYRPDPQVNQVKQLKCPSCTVAAGCDMPGLQFKHWNGQCAYQN